MANTPHNWTSGEVITADKLNNMPFIFQLAADGEPEGDLTNATWTVTTQTSLSDIKAAFDDGRYVIGAFNTGAGMILQVPVASAQEENGDITIIGSGITSLSGLTTHMTFRLLSTGNSQFVMRVDTGSSSTSNGGSTHIIDLDYSGSTINNVENSVDVRNRIKGTYDGNNAVKQDVIYRIWIDNADIYYYRPTGFTDNNGLYLEKFAGQGALVPDPLEHSGTTISEVQTAPGE